MNLRKKEMISQSIQATNGTCRFILRRVLAELQIILTHPNSTPKDLKTTVGRLPPMESQVTAPIPCPTQVAMIHTKLMNGTKRVFPQDSTGIVLRSAPILGYGFPTLPDSPLIGYSNPILPPIHGVFKPLRIQVHEMLSSMLTSNSWQHCQTQSKLFQSPMKPHRVVNLRPIKTCK